MPDFNDKARAIIETIRCCGGWRQEGTPDELRFEAKEFDSAFIPFISTALSQAYEEGVRAEKARSAQECRQEIARTPMLKHAYVPHSDYPWFCDVCGYPEHEVMQHDRAAISTQGDGLT